MKRLAKFTIIWFVVVMLLEVFAFNIKFWLTLGNDEISYDEANVVFGSGVQYDESTDSYIVKDSSQSSLTFENVNEHINSVCVDITDLVDSTSDHSSRHYSVEVIAEDEGNSWGAKCGTFDSDDSVKESTYKMVHLNGDSKWVKLIISMTQDIRPDIKTNSFRINNITINPNIPFSIRCARVVLLLIIGVFCYMFNPKSSLYKQNLFEDVAGKNNVKRIIRKSLIHVIIALAFCVGACLFVGYAVDPENSFLPFFGANSQWPAYGQYNELAEALIDGHTYLDRQPPEVLSTLKNPYDGGLRFEALGEHWEYDFAYYDGKYYSYFGVVPALLAFVPFHLIFGHGILTWRIVLFMGVLLMFAIFAFTYEFSRKYYPNTSIAVYILTTLFITFATSWIYLVYVGIVYSVPIIFSLFFSFLGLALWMRSTQGGRINKLALVLGSLCIALTLGCRPQFVLVAIFAFAIFGEETIKSRLFFSKKGLVNTILVIIPFLVVGIGIMMYNYVRFQSPFDFGANYNITSNDMTHRGIVLSRIPLGVFTYLFMPFTMSGAFPFFHECLKYNDYLGFTNYEPIFGGALFFNALLLVTALIFRLRKQLKENRILLFSWIAIILGLFIMILDIQVAGITQRYLSDFCWLFAIPTIGIIMTIEKWDVSGTILYIWRNALLIGVLLSIILNIWSITISDRFFCMREWNPDLFYRIKDIVEFY